MIDVIGTITEVETVDGEEVENTLDGWHVNAAELIDDWSAFIIEPATPRRVFWGAVTFCYRFVDEAEYLENQLEVENG